VQAGVTLTKKAAAICSRLRRLCPCCISISIAFGASPCPHNTAPRFSHPAPLSPPNPPNTKGFLTDHRLPPGSQGKPKTISFAAINLFFKAALSCLFANRSPGELPRLSTFVTPPNSAIDTILYELRLRYASLRLSPAASPVQSLRPLSRQRSLSQRCERHLAARRVSRRHNLRTWLDCFGKFMTGY
jgi:hypothetical protein